MGQHQNSNAVNDLVDGMIHQQYLLLLITDHLLANMLHYAPLESGLATLLHCAGMLQVAKLELTSILGVSKCFALLTFAIESFHV